MKTTRNGSFSDRLSFSGTALALVVCAALALLGCGSNAPGDVEAMSEQAKEVAAESPAGTQPSATGPESAVPPEPSPAPAPAPVAPAPTKKAPAPKATPATAPAPQPAPEPIVETLTVPAGTVLSVVFDSEISSETSLAGDPFSVRVVAPVSIDGRTAIAEGDTISGEVLEAVSTKKIGGTARLDLEFNELRTASGAAYPVSAVFLAEGKKQTKKDAATIGGAAAGGALLGRIIGHQKDKDTEGTAIGAVVGAAVGTAIAATNETDPVTFVPGTVVDIRLDESVIIKRPR